MQPIESPPPAPSQRRTLAAGPAAAAKDARVGHAPPFPDEDDRESRPHRLGAFERIIDFYMHRNPLQFSLVAKLTTHITATALTSSLSALQRRHPMLRVAVDRAAPKAVFRDRGRDPPRNGPGWRSLAIRGRRRADPTDPPTPGPLGARRTRPRGVRDALSSQEDLLAHPGAAVDLGGAPSGTLPDGDERLSPVGELVPFPGLKPHVDTLALDVALTKRLIHRCRLEDTQCMCSVDEDANTCGC